MKTDFHEVRVVLLEKKVFRKDCLAERAYCEGCGDLVLGLDFATPCAPDVVLEALRRCVGRLVKIGELVGFGTLTLYTTGRKLKPKRNMVVSLALDGPQRMEAVDAVFHLVELELADARVTRLEKEDD